MYGIMQILVKFSCLKSLFPEITTYGVEINNFTFKIDKILEKKNYNQSIENLIKLKYDLVFITVLIHIIQQSI